MFNSNFAKVLGVYALAFAIIAPSVVTAQSALNVQITAPADGAEVEVNSPVSFRGTATGGDSATYGYSWTFGDGSLTNAQNTSHNYTITGSKTVRLQVTDINGITGTDEVTINVVDQTSECTPLINELDLTNPNGNHPRATNVTKNSATIVWTTCEAGTSRVVYGTQSVATPNKDDSKLGYEFSTTLDSNKVTSHSVELTGLQPNTKYYFRVLSAR